MTVAYVANMWDAKTLAHFLRTDATCTKGGNASGQFDLPEAVTRIRSGGDNALEVGTLKLSNLKLGVGSSKE